MKNFESAGFQKLFAVIAVTTFMAATTQGAFAAVPGCNPAVQKAAEAKANAMVAIDKAAADQIQKQPVSVLSTSCFNEAAGVSATAGGNIFSGDFSSDLMPVINTALESFSDDFEGSIIDFFSSEISDLVGGDLGSIVGGSLGGLLSGGLGDLFGGGSTSVSSDFDCDGIKTVQDAIAMEGITSGVIMPTTAELIAGTMPTGAGAKFKKSFDASAGQNVFSTLNTSMGLVPKPSAPNFSSSVGLCDTLSAAGITGGC